MAIETVNHIKKNGTHIIKDAREKYEDMSGALLDAILEGKRSLHRMQRTASRALHEGSEKVADAAVKMDRKAHRNPWVFVGGAALAALAIGWVMGACGRKKQPWE